MAKKSVLIVEDEKALSEAYQMVLKKEGFLASAAYNGEQALKHLNENEPDLILLDLRMPKMNGIEFLKKYKPADKHPDVKIIVFSNLDSENEIEQAYSLGAHKYMLKAWASPKELVRFVRETLAA